MASVTVVGVDGREIERDLLKEATLLVGGERHLRNVDFQAERVTLGPLEPALERIVAHEGHVVVLASGDPGFFGIVRALRDKGIRPTVIPAASSVAMAFAKAGLNWDDALVVSAHGREPRRAVNVCRAHHKVAVLTAPGFGPAELAAALDGWDRSLLIAERLGTEHERVGGMDEGPWADPNVVLVLDPRRQADGPSWMAGAGPSPTGWALPEDAFEHRDSMITKAEVRALVLARLGPRLGDLVWDVGAGSGSVGIECARLGAAVIAIDRDPLAAQQIARNTAGLSVRVVNGSDLDWLPDPDAVFAGGGGLPVLVKILKRKPERLVAALAAIERVGPALAAMRDAGYAAEAVALQASRLSPLPDGSHRLAAQNPVFVLSGVWR